MRRPSTTPKQQQLQRFLRTSLSRIAPTALEDSQGSPYVHAPAADAARRRPIDSGLVDRWDWKNPYTIAMFPFSPDVANGQMALADNMRRAYLLIQNRGPGNLFYAFGQAPTPQFSFALVSSEKYELIGGIQGGAFVPRDSLWLLTDTAGTVVVIGEGVAVQADLPEWNGR